jgi:hypothetical protein
LVQKADWATGWESVANGHTIRMGIPFHPEIDFSEIEILQKMVKQFPILGNKFPINGKQNTTFGQNLASLRFAIGRVKEVETSIHHSITPILQYRLPIKYEEDTS